MNFGVQAEKEGAEWLCKRLGARVLERNYRCKTGEIDLILEQSIGNRLELVFVEVRARAPDGWVSGAESIGHRKQMRLLRTIRHYLASYRGGAGTLRFDVLDWDGNGWIHIPNQRLGY